MHTGIWEGHLKSTDHLEYLGIDKSIILKCILSLDEEGKNWIYLAQNRDTLRAVVDTAMDLQIM